LERIREKFGRQARQVRKRPRAFLLYIGSVRSGLCVVLTVFNSIGLLLSGRAIYERARTRQGRRLYRRLSCAGRARHLGLLGPACELKGNVRARLILCCFRCGHHGRRADHLIEIADDEHARMQQDHFSFSLPASGLLASRKLNRHAAGSMILFPTGIRSEGTSTPSARSKKAISRASPWTAVDRDAGWLVDDKHHPVAIEKPCEQFFVGHGRRPLWLDRASTTSRAI
jgi:hypothetical protein